MPTVLAITNFNLNSLQNHIKGDWKLETVSVYHHFALIKTMCKLYQIGMLNFKAFKTTRLIY